MIFIGYHARAGTPDAVLKHTMTTRLLDVDHQREEDARSRDQRPDRRDFDVPVVLVSGDKAIGEQARELFGDIETVVVKEGIGTAELGIHPRESPGDDPRKNGRGLKRLKSFKPFKLSSALYPGRLLRRRGRGPESLLDSRRRPQGRAHRELHRRDGDGSDETVPPGEDVKALSS